MSTAWSAEVIVKAVRDLLSRSTVVSQGFRLVAIWLERDELVVSFRWWRDPNRYAVRFPLPDSTLPESPWTGLPVVTSQDWAHDVVGLLAEELGTGAVRHARRRRHHGVVELDWHDAPNPCPHGYHSSAVVLPSALDRSLMLRADFGRSLAAVGLDVAVPRRQHRKGRLLSWLKLTSDRVSPEPVGHASVSWHPTLPTTATLDVLQLLPGVIDTAASYLARMAVHDAAEAGAKCVQTTCTHPQLTQVGFHRAGQSGPVSIDTTTLEG